MAWHGDVALGAMGRCGLGVVALMPEAWTCCTIQRTVSLRSIQRTMYTECAEEGEACKLQSITKEGCAAAHARGRLRPGKTDTDGFHHVSEQGGN